MTDPSSSGPFAPLALAAGVCANLATAILQHHAQAFEGTLVGRMLQWAGLIEPTFTNHLHDALRKALELYFKEYPHYALTGIAAFFLDSTVANQIRCYILDRRPIDKGQLQVILDHHLGHDPITATLLARRGLQPERIIPDFLRCYRRVLHEQLSVPHMALLLEILDQTDTVIQAMRASEERLKDMVSHVISQIESQSRLLEHVTADQYAIKRHLGLDRPYTALVAAIQATLDTTPRGAMFAPGGLCSGYPLQPLPDRYFLAQVFRSERDDLRNALTIGLAELGVQPIVANDALWAGHILCKTSALIQSTPFGIYQLTSSQNRNVYLELGIAIGLGRPFILVKDKEAEVPPLVQGLDYYAMDSYLELRYELGEKVRPFLTEIASYRPQKLPPSGSQATVVIAHGGLDVIDFCVPVAKMIAEYNLMPVILDDPTGRLGHYLELEGVPHQVIGSVGRLRLDDTVAAIQAARVGVYRIEQIGAPDTFLALGVSMGLNRPGLLIHKTQGNLPSDLQGLSTLAFTAYTALQQDFAKRLGDVVHRYR